MERKTSTLLSVGISAALVAAAIWFLFDHHSDMWSGGSWRTHHGMMSGGSGMGILMILFWGVVIIALILLISAALTGRGASANDEALDILRKRYARGEIDKDRFDAMLLDLQQREGKQ